MAAGQLQCYGSPLFLKKKFGAGYYLTIGKNSNQVSTDWITDTVRRHIPAAKLESSAGTEVTYSLPNGETSKFKSLLTEIETDSKLGIDHYGISVTTMEEVFLK